LEPGDNGHVEDVHMTERIARWARRAAAYFHGAFQAAENRTVLSGASNIADLAIAALATALAVIAAVADHNGSGTFTSVVPGAGTTVIQYGHQYHVTAWILVAVVLTTAPLAVRRKYPIGTFCVVLAALIAGRSHATAFTFAAAIFAAYSAVVYCRHRLLALLSLAAAAIVVTAVYPNTAPPVEAQYTALLVLLPTVAAGNLMRTWRQRAGSASDQLRRAETEHQAATQRAIALERSRIASELHDVVTHNVSVMVVQAGAARRVLDSSPADAREALLAIETGGRNAMTELRHLLSLLAPDGSTPESADVLFPQPGLDLVPELILSVSAAGLPVSLSVSGTPRARPAGLDLAAFRVVQEGLTNVLKHAPAARTTVRIEYRDRELLLEVADDGAGGTGQGPGSGRGLLGLRERIAIYGGSLDVGPRPGGGWRVRAMIPLEAAGQVLPAEVASA
jgi:signal transduction histidine kinase